MKYYNHPKDNIGTADVAGKCWASTTNYVNWEFHVEIEELPDIAELHFAIENGKRRGKFNVVPNGENWYVLPSDGRVVLVLTPRSRAAYLKFLRPLVDACSEQRRAGLSNAEWEKTSLREKITLFEKFRATEV